MNVELIKRQSDSCAYFVCVASVDRAGRGKGIISWLAQAHYFGQHARRPQPKGNRFTVD